MKRFRYIPLALTLFCSLTVAQNGYQAARTFFTSAVASDIGLSQANRITYHQVAWQVTGGPAGCTVSIDSSPDGSAWTTGGIITGQTCTTTGSSTVVNANAAFIRINVTALSGGTAPTLNVNYTGWSTNPAGGGGGTASALINTPNVINDLTDCYLTADLSAQSSATPTTIGCTWNLAANKRYLLNCSVYVTFAVSATIAFDLNGPGTPTSYTLAMLAPTPANSTVSKLTANAVAYGTATATSTAPGASTVIIPVTAGIQNGATASGTQLALRTIANGTNTITVLHDSACHLTQQN
jgi:hypothetical protein